MLRKMGCMYVLVIAILATQADSSSMYDFGGTPFSWEQLMGARKTDEMRVVDQSETVNDQLHPHSAKFTPQIVGGKDAPAGWFPFVVLLIKDGDAFCGGSILNEEWILTSAFCANASSTITVLAGSYNRSASGLSPYAQTRTVDWMLVHPQWRNTSTVAAVALMHVSQPWTWSTGVRPVKILDHEFKYPATGVAMGWGSISPGTPFQNLSLDGWINKTVNGSYVYNQPLNLQWVVFYLLSAEQANDRYARFFDLYPPLNILVGQPTDHQLYTGSKTEGTCGHADDGMPMIVSVYGADPPMGIVAVNTWRLSCTKSVDIWQPTWYYRDFVNATAYLPMVGQSPWLTVTLFPTLPGSSPAQAYATVVFPYAVSFDELWLTLPKGFMANIGGRTKLVSLMGLSPAPAVVTVQNGIVELRWLNAVNITAGTAIRFVIDKLRVAGTCDPITWTVRLFSCADNVTPTPTPVPTLTPTETPTRTDTNTDQNKTSANMAPAGDAEPHGFVMRKGKLLPLDVMGRPCIEDYADVPLTVTYLPMVNCAPVDSRRMETVLNVPYTDLFVPIGGNYPTNAWVPIVDQTLFVSAMTALLNSSKLVPGITPANIALISAKSDGYSHTAVVWQIIGLPNPQATNALVWFLRNAVNSTTFNWFLTNSTCTRGGAILTSFGSPAVNYPTVLMENQPPVLSVSAFNPTLEDTPLNLSVALLDDSDTTELMQVTVSVTNGVVALFSIDGLTQLSGLGSGSASFQYVGSKGAITRALSTTQFIPTPQWSGMASISIDISDQGHPAGAFGGILTAHLAIPIQVIAVNDPPTITPGVFTVQKDGSLQVTGISVADIDALPSDMFNVTVSSERGTFWMAYGGNKTCVSANTSCVVFGNLSQINLALAAITFTPTPMFFGKAYLDITVDDQGHNPQPKQTSYLQQLITVTPRNDAPMFLQPLSTTHGPEDSSIAIPTIQIMDYDMAAPGVACAANLTIFGRTGTNSIINGMYENTWTLFNGRSYYRRWAADQSSFVHLYYLSGVQEWALGPTLGGSSVYAYAAGDVLEPQDTTGWTVWGGTAWALDSAVRVRCISLGVANFTVNNGTLTFHTTTDLNITLVAPKKWKMTGALYAINAALGDITYQGDLNFNGNDTLTLSFADTQEFGPGAPIVSATTVLVTVDPVNDGPSISTPQPVYSTDRLHNVTIPISFSDVDAGVGNLEVTVNVTNGTLSLPPPVNGSYMVAGYPDLVLRVLYPSNGSTTKIRNFLRLSGPLPLLNEVFAKLTYETFIPLPTFVPNIVSNFYNLDTLKVWVSDNGNTGSGGALTAALAVNITVTAQLFPTCAAYLQTFPQYCGCYFVVPTTAPYYTKNWVVLPTTFPSSQFLTMKSANRYVQGCCAALPNDLRNATFSVAGSLMPCNYV